MTSLPLIDVHQHILPAPYVEAVGAYAVGSQGSSGRVPAWSVENAIEGMDDAGIQTAIVSVSSPGLRGLKAEDEHYWAAWCNDFAARMASIHSGRFGFFATLPIQNENAMLTECDRSLGVLNADGVCLLSNYGGDYLGSARFQELYAELNRRGAVIFVHPTSPQNEILVGGLSASTLEFPFDTTRAIASLIFSGTIQRYPSIRWIFSHAGGAMPYLAGRIQTLIENKPALSEFLPNGLNHELAKLYFDSALSANRVAMNTLADEFTHDQCLFGTDYPFGPPSQMKKSVAGISELGWETEARDKIFFKNALKLFPRFSQLQELKNSRSLAT